MSLSITTRLAQSDRQLSQALDEQLVLLSLDKSAYFETNALGKVIWERLTEPTALAPLIDELLPLYDVERSRLEADVLRFVEALLDAGLARVCDGP